MMATFGLRRACAILDPIGKDPDVEVTFLDATLHAWLPAKHVPPGV